MVGDRGAVKEAARLQSLAIPSVLKFALATTISRYEVNNDVCSEGCEKSKILTPRYNLDLRGARLVKET